MNKPIFCVSVGFYGTTFPRLPTVFDTGNLMSQPQSVKRKRAAGEADQPPTPPSRKLTTFDFTRNKEKIS